MGSRSPACSVPETIIALIFSMASSVTATADPPAPIDPMFVPSIAQAAHRSGPSRQVSGAAGAGRVRQWRRRVVVPVVRRRRGRRGRGAGPAMGRASAGWASAWGPAMTTGPVTSARASASGRPSCTGVVVATGWMGAGCGTEDGTAADGLACAIAAGCWAAGGGDVFAARVSVSPVTPTTASSAIPPARACCCRGARRIRRGACPIWRGVCRSRRNPASTRPAGAGAP